MFLFTDTSLQFCGKIVPNKGTVFFPAVSNIVKFAWEISCVSVD
jgi:hypothetical protein